MFQNIYIEREHGEMFGGTHNIVHIWDDKTGYQTFEFKNYAYRKDPDGQYKTLFGDRASKIKTWSKWDVDKGKIFESDIPMETRVLVDMYPDSDDVSDGHRLLIYDIEVETTDGLPDIQKANNRINGISYYDAVSDEYAVYILDEKNEIEEHRDENVEIVPFDTEEELLVAFLQKWEEINPTIITGWNIDYFDNPYLYRRLSIVLGSDEAKRLSPIRKVYYNKNRNQFFFAGVSSLDYYGLYRQFTYTGQPSYTLDFISKLELGEGKIENPYGTLNEFKEKDIKGFIKYNLVDTELVKKMNDKLNFIELAQGICHTGHVPYESVYYSSRWIEGAMLVYMKHQNMVAPNKNPKNKELMHDSADSFSGAFVKEPIPGKHEWIYDLDFTSLYPSIIMSLNISPETKIGRIYEWDSEKFLSDKSIDYRAIIGEDEGLLSGKQIDTMITKYDYAISSNGVIYKKDRQGIVPQILEEWFKGKENYDKLMKQYGAKGDEEKSKYYKQRRTISKVMLNSVYGVLGLPVFRFYDLDNASAVTETGQQLIKYTEIMGNNYYNKIIGKKEDYCIYIDTDSVFFSALPLIKKLYPEINIDDEEKMASIVLKITSQVQDYLNSSFDIFCNKFLNIQKHKFDIKQEIIGRSGLWVAKKRYAIWVINDSGIKKNKMDYKGLDIVRSSFPSSFKEYLKKLLTSILKNVSRDKIDDELIKFKNNIVNLSLDEISVPTSVQKLTKYGTKRSERSKIYGNWIKGAPNHVKAALSYNEFIDYHKLNKTIPKIGNGEKIKWVYLKDNPFGIGSMAIRGYDDSDELINFINKYIDKNKMFERILEKKIADFYNALKWDIPSAKQKIIDTFFEF